MTTDKPCELEAAGVDPDGFHEDPDAPVPGESGQSEDVHHDRPSGVYACAFKDPKAKREHVRVVSKPGPEWLVPGPDGETLAPSVRPVGCFLIRPIGHKRCRIFNLLTGIGHVTYGSDEEIDLEYTRQTESWGRKLAVEKLHGNGWKAQKGMKLTAP